jgi:Polyketide cyclase / dehydrase and lipid transport
VTRVPLRVHEHVRCPIEKAFDLMADARNEATWNGPVSRAELVSEEPVGLGSRFLVVNRGQEYVGTISRHERPHQVTFEVDGKQLDITGSFTFTPDADGTAVDAEFDFHPKGTMKLLFPLIAPRVRRDLPRRLASFKSFCERC